MTKTQLYKQWREIWIRLDDMPFDMEQYLGMWEGLAESYGYYFSFISNEKFAHEINGTDTFNSETKFVEVCKKYFGE